MIGALPDFWEKKNKEDDDEKEVKFHGIQRWRLNGIFLWFKWRYILFFIFNNLSEQIFISINFPLIIKEERFKGRKSVIYYISKILSYEVRNFIISRSNIVNYQNVR